MSNDKQPQIESEYLRTLMRKDTMDRLRAVAQHYTTGWGKWDYNVAITFLLDFYDYHNRNLELIEVHDKLDAVMNAIQLGKQGKEEVPKKQIEMLGGHKEDVRK